MFTVSKKHVEISGSGTKILASMDHSDMYVDVLFDTNGGIPSSILSSYSLGKTYSQFPSAQKEGFKIDSWYRDAELMSQVLTSDYVDFRIRNMYAKWNEVKYTKLEYITNTGRTQYIKTGIIPTKNTSFELKFTTTSVSETWSVFFGSTKSDDSPNSVLLRFYSTSSLLNPWFGQSTYSSPTISYSHGTQHTVLLKYNSCTYDGTSYSISSNDLTSPYEIYLFCGNYPNGTKWRPQLFNCYYFKIYESNALVLDLIPVKDPDGVVCMYDTVSDSYFYNQGSGSFIAGPEIS